MTMCELLRELQQRGFRLGVVNGKLAAHPSSLLSTDLRKGIRHHKQTLIRYFAPCRYCGNKLTVAVYQTWFQVYCPSKPIHFLIEEHQDSFGKTLEAEQKKAA